MKTFCRTCGLTVDYSIVSQQESFTMEGLTFSVMQKHCFCSVCGEELYPEDLMDQNIEAAHEAYRVAKGSITVAEIKALLEKYKIGANPLSKLLGWGENTIERQMKHTIPDAEHADQLKRLFNPLNMANLLLKNGSVISDVALIKSSEACVKCLKELISDQLCEEKEKNPSFFEKPITLNSKSAVTIDDNPQRNGYTIAEADYPIGNHVISNPFDSLCAA